MKNIFVQEVAEKVSLSGSTLFTTLFTALLVAVFAGCQDQGFKGSGGTTTGKTQTAADAKPLPSIEVKQVVPINQDNEISQLNVNKANEALMEDGSLSDDDKKILGCIEEWGSIEVSKESLKGYKKLGSTSEGFSSGTIKDTKATDTPRLVLVKATATGFAGTHIELLNPKGWYCIDVANVGFSSSRILMHCDAEEAGFTQVNKGFSSTQVTRVGC